MKVDIVDVEHGACAFIVPPSGGRLAMVDCGHNATKKWWPSIHLQYTLKRTALDYMFITNADHDHYSDLKDVVAAMPIHWFYRSWKITSEQFLAMKKESGPLSDDAVAYHALTKSHNYGEGDVAVPSFNQGMEGIIAKRFCNDYGEMSFFGQFKDTNNLSMATFFEYNGFQILFPGDLQVPGWKQLLKDPSFVAELKKTTILVASHHGREDGFCAEVFDHCSPLAVVMSDKEIEHGTQEGMAGVYGAMVAGNGVIVKGVQQPRKVLTTRNDGSISLQVADATHFDVQIHYG